MAHYLRQWRPDISTRHMIDCCLFFDTQIRRTPKPHEPNHRNIMNKLITLTLAATTLVVVSSCATKSSAPASQSMPGMSAEEHAKMTKGGSMRGMKK